MKKDSEHTEHLFWAVCTEEQNKMFKGAVSKVCAAVAPKYCLIKASADFTDSDNVQLNFIFKPITP